MLGCFAVSSVSRNSYCWCRKIIILFSYVLQVLSKNPLLNQQANEKLALDRQLAKAEETALADLNEQLRIERQDSVVNSANKLSEKLNGKHLCGTSEILHIG